MAVLSACPQPGDIQRYLRGEVPEPEAALLDKHLSECGSCSETLHKLQADDTLVKALQARASIEDHEKETVAKLVTQLRSLKAPTGHATDAAADGGVQPGAAVTVDGRPSSPQETSERYDFLAPAQEAGELGRLGSYRVVRVLGEGGMGVVFESQDSHLKRPVALKVLKPVLAACATARQRFLREAQSAAAIEHEHIVPIYQVGEDRGIPFLAMQLLKGETLDDRLRREGPLPTAEVLRIGREIAEGLAAAHGRGLIHRDVKPGNIWLEGGRGRVKLLDFGLARAAGDDVRLTQSGMIAGTPAYMSPEQAQGAAVDSRCDLFSLGCVLYQLCTGRLPFRGEHSIAMLLAVVQDRPTPPHELNPGVPAAVSELVMKLLAKHPGERPPSASAVAEALAALEKDQSGGGERTGRDEPCSLTAAAPQKRPQLLVPIAAGLLLLVAGAVLVPQIIIRIKSKDGETVIKVPPGAEVTVERDGKVIAKVPEVEKPKPAAVVIKPEPFALPGGAPLSVMALVSGPAPIKGVRSWIIETRGHRGQVNAVAYHPEGRLLASAGDDASIRIWEADTGRLVRAMVGHKDGVLSIAWSPDGKALASAGWDQTIRLWGAGSGQLLRTFQGHEGQVHAVAWSPDGKTVASGSRDGTVRMWDVAGGALVRRLQAVGSGGESEVSCVAWSPDGKTLAAGTGGKKILMWPTDAEKPALTLEGSSPCLALAWSPDGKLLAAGYYDAPTRVWDPVSGKTRHSFECPGSGFKHGLAWSPDGKTLASEANLWDMNSGRRLVRIDAEDYVRRLSWAPDGKTLASAGEGSQVRIWKVNTGYNLRTFQGHTKHFSPNRAELPVQEVAWSPDGKNLAFATKGDNIARLWEADSGKLVRTIEADTGWFRGLAWAPDGKTLATGPGPVRFWEVSSGKLIRTLQVGHTRFLAWSPDGKTFAPGDGTDTLQLWEADSGKPLRTLQGHNRFVRAAIWSPNGKVLVTCDVARNARLWDPKSGKLLRSLWGNVAAWAPNGKILATGGDDDQGRIHLWDPESGQELDSLPGQTGEVTSIGWLADGKKLVTVATDQTVRLWDPSSDDKVLVRTVEGPAWWGALSPDGKVLALAGPNAVHLLMVETGRPCGTWVALADNQWLAIQGDGHYRGSPQVERELVYVVQTDQGQETLSPEEFRQRYGWQNDPEKVRLLP